MSWPFVGREELLHRVINAVQIRGGAILEGPPGIGKTRLIEAAIPKIGAAGWHVERAHIGYPAATAIPFAALSHLVPSLTVADPLNALEAAPRAIMARGGGKRLLLVVDDAHVLDDASMTVVHRLATASDAAVLMTRRSGQRGNDETITSIWKDDLAVRIEVPPLDREAHDALARHALGAVFAATVFDRLWALTRGNPLYLREILNLVPAAALDAWLAGRADDPLRDVPRELAQLVATRTRKLPRSAHEALEIIAIAEPIRLDLLARLATRETILELERDELISIEIWSGVAHARTAHPVYGAGVRAMVPPFRRASVARALGAAYVADGLRHDGDAAQASRWLIESGEVVEPDLCARAAREALARGDAAFAERLARLALHSSGDVVDALITLGTALSVRRVSDEARQTLERALTCAESEDERTRTALALSRHHAWVSRDFARGAAVLAEALPAVRYPGARSELEAELAFFSAAAGDAQGTVRIADQVLSDAKASPQAQLTAIIHATRARTMLGQFDALEHQFDRGEELATRLRTTLPLALDQLTNNRVFWLRFVNIEQAREVARSGYERSLHEGGASGMWSGTLSWLSVDAGDLDAALGLMRRGNAEFERFDPFHNVLMLRALAALVHAVRGEIDLARAWLDRAGPIENMEPRSRVWTERASAWVIAGTDGEGAHRAIAAGESAEQQTIITWGAALLYHDAVRLGGAGLAADHLSRIASMTTAPLVELMSRHACAAAAEDAQALMGIAEEFVARGSPLLGAEALAQASMFSRATGADRARALMRASNLAERCPGAATPLMRKIASPLSEREQDVARAVARGATSRDVAGLLSLSVRTVDNHLASIYRKLELSGRDEITSFFG